MSEAKEKRTFRTHLSPEWMDAAPAWIEKHGGRILLFVLVCALVVNMFYNVVDVVRLVVSRF